MLADLSLQSLTFSQSPPYLCPFHVSLMDGANLEIGELGTQDSMQEKQYRVQKVCLMGTPNRT